MRFDKNDLLIYAITDRGCIGEKDFFGSIEAALKGGVKFLQLREKDLGEQELIKEAVKAKALCDKYGAKLIINDNYRAALESGAHGLHVGIEDTPVSEIRKLVGDKLIIGATAKTPEQARSAQEQGADYLGVGAVFASPTKKGAIRITHEQFREIVSCVKIPAVAIGGISCENMSELRGMGASGAALVSAVFSAEDIESRVKELRELCVKTFL